MFPVNPFQTFYLLSAFFLFSFRFVGNTKDVDDTMFCGYIDTIYVSYTLCSDSKNIICEKLANPVKIENTLMSEIPYEKYD